MANYDSSVNDWLLVQSIGGRQTNLFFKVLRTKTFAEEDVLHHVLHDELRNEFENWRNLFVIDGKLQRQKFQRRLLV
jgi:hypothetical protein